MDGHGQKCQGYEKLRSEIDIGELVSTSLKVKNCKEDPEKDTEEPLKQS
jgi:hypothetical protein